MRLRHIFTIAIIFHCFDLPAQKESVKNQVKLGEHLLASNPDSALAIFSSLQKDYWNQPVIYWYIGAANHYLSNADKACVNFFLSLNLGYTPSKRELEDCNCPSWQNQWFELIKDYEEIETDNFSITSTGLSNYKYRNEKPFMVSINHRYLVYEGNRKREVELKQIIYYSFGTGLTFIDLEGELIFKIDNHTKLTAWEIQNIP